MTRRWRRWLPWLVAGGLATAAGSTAAEPLLSVEGGGVPFVAVAGVASTVLACGVVALVAAVRREISIVRFGVPFVCAAVFIVFATLAASPLHWYLSEPEFAEIVDGERSVDDCTVREPCRIGWFDVVEADILPDLPTVWVRSRGDCYIEWGFARLGSSQSFAEAEQTLLGRHSGFTKVTSHYGNWVEICVTS